LDFFEQKERSRSTSRWLVLWYLVAVALTVAPCRGGRALSWWLAAATAALVAGCILWVSAYRMWQFREGGHAVADLLGAATSILSASPAERRLNVVDEMSIASGVSVPPVYVTIRARTRSTPWSPDTRRTRP
jgi:hypothetical protein